MVPLRHLRRNLAGLGDRHVADQCPAAGRDASLGMAIAVHIGARDRDRWSLYPPGSRTRREIHRARSSWSDRRAARIVLRRIENPALGDTQSDRTQSDLGRGFLYAFRLYDRVLHQSCSDSKIGCTRNYHDRVGRDAGDFPGAGALSDWVGRKPLLLAGAVGMLVFSLPLFQLLRSPKFGVILTGQLCFTVILCLFFGAEPAATAEAFPGRVRCSGAAISHNICFAVLGGTAPMVATYLIARTQNEMSPSIYLMAAALVSIISILTLSETAKAPLA